MKKETINVTRCRIVTNIFFVETIVTPRKECFCKMTQDGLRPTREHNVNRDKQTDMNIDLTPEQKRIIEKLAPLQSTILRA